MKKGFAPIIILLTFILLIGIFFAATQGSRIIKPKQNVQNTESDANTSPNPAPFISSQISTPNPPTSFKSTFQEILYKNCDKANNQLKEALPVVIDTNTIANIIGPQLPGSHSCWTANSDFFILDFGQPSNATFLKLYDKYSDNPASGRGLAFGLVGKTTIKEINNIKTVSWYEISGEAPLPSDTIEHLAQRTSVFVKAQKGLLLKNGETIYAEIEKISIKPGDPELVNFLKTNLPYWTFRNENGLLFINKGEEVRTAITTRFSGQLLKTATELERILSAVLIK